MTRTIPRRTTLILAMALGMTPFMASAQSNHTSAIADRPQEEERLSFQTHGEWNPRVHVNADVAMVYDIDVTLPQRLKTWLDRGYIPQVMSGVTWGEYAEYYYGDFDGINHMFEVQKEEGGGLIGHGKDNYYICPSISYGKFLIKGVKRAIDAGAMAIHMEEPEFWVRAGYSEGFKREWRDYYGEPWQNPVSSPDAQYRASKLKYYLYRRTLQQIFDFVKEYEKEIGKDIKCYVPTHSMINYAHWGIVSPQSSLLEVGCDGYIAQVWTGTARSPNMLDGKKAERTFETAFLEYGAMMNLVRASGARVWFLNDPIEDNPRHTWEDYQQNWESTLTASLLWPQVWRFEVMPWPERIFHRKYPIEEPKGPDDEVEKAPIPPAYATELMVVINALNDMNQSEVEWDCGTRDIGVLVSDSMMFQRAQPTPSDPFLGSFFGLALPLVTRGMPVEPVQLENATLPNALTPYKILLATYEGMKPMREEDSRALAKWVRDGGVLVFVDDDADPYNAVKSWWNSAPRQFEIPRHALFEHLGLAKDAAPGTHRVGRGALIYKAQSPAALTYETNGSKVIRDWVREACKLADIEYRESGHMTLRRGRYVVAAGLSDTTTLSGSFVSLFDPHLEVRKSITLEPGDRQLLVDLDHKDIKTPSVIAAACKILGAETTEDGAFRFYAEGPDKIEAVARIRLAKKPASILLDDDPLPSEASDWDESSKTLRIRFPNSASGHWLTVRQSYP